MDHLRTAWAVLWGTFRRPTKTTVVVHIHHFKKPGKSLIERDPNGEWAFRYAYYLCRCGKARVKIESVGLR